MNIDDLYRVLRAGHAQLQGIVDTVSDPLLVLDGNLVVQSASRAFFKSFHVDRDETIGKPIYELGNGQWNIPKLRKLLEEVIPHSTAVVDFQVDHVFPDLGSRSMLVTARTLFHPDDLSRTMLLSIHDATDRLHRENPGTILLGELHHRIKNMLASAEAMARQATTEGRSAGEFRDEFLGRLRNLVTSSELAYGPEIEGGLRRLLEKTLAPYATEGSVTLVGDAAFDPGPHVLLSLSLVLHELATNAAKYGALSMPDGRVEVTWDLDASGPVLHLQWSERGGPPAAEPIRKGYGTKLISSVTTFNLGGTLEQDFSRDGLTVNLTIPLSGP